MNIYDSTFADLKKNFDDNLNVDKSTYLTSNDEPTPIGCVEEMLNKIPDAAWSNDVKILDPCCGNGNFHLFAWDKLRKMGVSDSDIVKKHLYFNDTNRERLENVKRLYGAEANITYLDFLQYPEDQKYDIIYANPPYAKFTIEGKRASKNHTMVRDFLSKSLKLLKPGGYLVYIVPDNWMSFADRNTVIKELTKYQFVHLNIHGAKKWFPKIGSSFTWLVLRKTPGLHHFRVESTYRGKRFTSYVKPGERSYMPLLWTRESQSIFDKTIDAPGEKFKVETSSDLHKYTKKENISADRSPNFRYKLIHTPKQTVWGDRPHKFQAGYKCFISTTDKYATFVDACGMTQSIAFVRCKDKEEAESVSGILNHKLYVFLNNLCRWGNFNNIRILQRFPVPANAADIYGSFGITSGEIEFLEEIVGK